jgi:hypothetical protein
MAESKAASSAGGFSSMQQSGGAPAWLQRVTYEPRSSHLRDIRGDYQVRAKLLSEQIKAAQQQFDHVIKELTQEYEFKINELRIDLDAVNAVLEFEERRYKDSSDWYPASDQASSELIDLALEDKRL